MLSGLIRRFPFRSRPTIFRHTSYAALGGPGTAMYGLTSFVAYKALGASEFEVAVLAAGLPLSHLLALLWARRVTAQRKAEFIFWPQLVTFGILLAMPFVNSSALFTALICAAMMTRSPMTSAMMAITRANYPAQWRSSLLAVATAGATISSAVYALIAGRILDGDPNGFRYLFPLAAGIGAVGAWQFRKVRVSGEGRAAGPRAAPVMTVRRVLGILLHNRSFRRYEYSFFVFGFANLMLSPVFPMFIEETLQAGYLEASLAIVAIPTVLSLIFLPIWGRVLDRYNPLLMRLVSNIIWVIQPLCCFFAHSMWPIFVGNAVVGMVSSGSGLVWLLGVNYFARKSEVPAYMALHETLTGIRALIAPFVGTWLMGFWGARYTFLAGAALMLVGALLMLLEVIREWNANGLRSYSQAELESERTGLAA